MGLTSYPLSVCYSKWKTCGCNSGTSSNGNM